MTGPVQVNRFDFFNEHERTVLGDAMRACLVKKREAFRVLEPQGFHARDFGIPQLEQMVQEIES